VPKVIESMTNILLIDKTRDIEFKIRVWRNQEIISDSYNNNDLIETAVDSFDQYKYDPHLLAELLSKMPRVSAVELLHEHDDGILIYQEWP